jgi:hypothetical protein
MKGITFRADPGLIEWLEGYVSRAGDVQLYRSVMKRLEHVNAGGKFTRDEMNER